MAPAAGGDRFGAVFAGGGADPELVRLVMRVMNLLELPAGADGPAARAAGGGRRRAAATAEARGSKRPSRDDLLAVVA